MLSTTKKFSCRFLSLCTMTANKNPVTVSYKHTINLTKKKKRERKKRERKKRKRKKREKRKERRKEKEERRKFDNIPLL